MQSYKTCSIVAACWHLWHHAPLTAFSAACHSAFKPVCCKGHSSFSALWLIADASYAVKNTLTNHHPQAIVNELMSADDTLLAALDSDFAATYKRYIERCGSQYGLSFK